MYKPQPNKHKSFGYNPKPDVAAILHKLPKGKMTRALNAAVLACFGDEKQQEIGQAEVQAIIIQTEE